MKKAVMYGAGNIGRGFMGQLFSMSGYETVFIDINETVINKLNEDNKYPVYITKNDKYEAYLVEHVRAVNGKDLDALAEEIATADIAATAVGVNVLPFIVPPLAKGIKSRFLKNGGPLNIIICENKIGADLYLRDMISKELNFEENEYFINNIGLVEASIGRMVPATPVEISKENALAVCVEQYCQLPVDKDAFKGKIPKLENMLPFAPFEFYIQRKLYMHNMSHALTAYLGYIRGYEFIWQAQLDPIIKLITLGALFESAEALSKEHGVDIGNLIKHSYDLLSRFENKLLGDSVERVGKDTVRKLSSEDRICGAIRLCQKHGIAPVSIIAALAAGLLFKPEKDNEAVMVSTFASDQGIEKALNKFCNINDDSIIKQVSKYYYMLSDNQLDDLFYYTERLKSK